MVKLFLTTIVSLGFLGIVQAQTFKFSAGYGFPWISQQLGVNSFSHKSTLGDPETSAAAPNMVTTTEAVRGSYGSGMIIGGAFGYKLSEHIAADLGLTYMLGKKYTTLSTYTDTQFHVLKSSSREVEASQSKAFLFTPAIKFITSERIFTPYFLFGPVLGKINFTRALDRVVEENGTKSTESRNTKYSGGVSLGLRAGIGVNVIVNSAISLFSEITFLGMNYYPKESEITRYDLNGEDKLNTLPRSIQETVYVKQVSTDSRQSADRSNLPSKAVRFPIGMSSVSTSAGVLVNLR